MRYKANGSDLWNMLSSAEQRVFVCTLETERASNVPEGIDDEGENWDFEDMVTVIKRAPADFCENSRVAR